MSDAVRRWVEARRKLLAEDDGSEQHYAMIQETVADEQEAVLRLVEAAHDVVEETSPLAIHEAIEALSRALAALVGEKGGEK